MTEADRRRDSELRNELHNLLTEYNAKAQPIITELAAIRARYPIPHVVWLDEASNISPEMVERVLGASKPAQI